jgi:hypothetical protein
MEMYDDMGGNSQHTDITLKASAQPFIVNWEEQEKLSFTVIWTWELSELIEWLKKCQESCYKIHNLQINCANA